MTDQCLYPLFRKSVMIGKTLGHYEIIGALGAGGMGEVYRARDTKLGREVAVKLLPTAMHTDEKALGRFEREAKALAALNHPNIVTIYSIEREADHLFLTMELVEGETLDRLISDEGMALEPFVKTAVQLADAVAAAHASGVVHRDLKPANIVVTDAGRVKVLDFGIARVPHATALTEPDTAIGTVAYMSPEQIRRGEVDGRSDIFSLGLIFYELLSGSRPFTSEYPASLMYCIVNEPVPRLSGQPAAVADLVERCLEKEPGERFATADDLRSALEGLLGSTAQTAQTPDVPAGVSVPEAQAAIDRGDWAEAYKILHATREERDLSPEEMEMLASCAEWISEVGEGIELREKAYAIYSRAGRNVDAGRLALILCLDYMRKNAAAVSRGWLRRCERLLQDEPESIEHGHLARRHAMMALGAGDVARATELNKQCSDIAERFDDPDLRAVALHDRGKILVARGDVDEGVALIDEAMTSAVSGEVAPLTLGALYCRTMSVCESLADYGRAREWSEAAWRWCQPYAASAFPGLCRIHSAEMMRHQGMWAEAEDAVRKACEDFSRIGVDSPAGEAYNELGRLALCKGDYEAAEEAFRQAHKYGCDPVPGLPLLRVAQGNGEAAVQTMDRALKETQVDRLRRAKLLVASIAVSLANSQLALAESAVAELAEISKDFRCQAFEAHALVGRGLLALERNENDEAATALRDAWTIFKEMAFPYDAACARLHLARAYLRLGNKEDARLQLEAATKTFGELGAKPDLQAANDLIGRLE